VLRRHWAICRSTSTAPSTTCRTSAPLPTLGFGLNWTPIPGYNVIVSETHDHQAPTIQQLDGPVVETPGVRLFDYATGQTVAVTQISGGNRALKADDRT
jgi:iron complex outermembrane receptor protein